MKIAKFLFIPYFLLKLSSLLAQNEFQNGVPAQILQIAPAIGLNPWPTADLVFSNLVEYNITGHFSLAAYSTYSHNNAFHRNFNYIQNEHNYSLSQKFGVGTTIHKKRASHAFLLLGGIKYSKSKETLENPEFETISGQTASFDPDFGAMYHLQLGKKKYFFSYRMYLPLYPYPIQRPDITAIDGNMANISLEFGLGIRLK